MHSKVSACLSNLRNRGSLGTISVFDTSNNLKMASAGDYLYDNRGRIYKGTNTKNIVCSVTANTNAQNKAARIGANCISLIGTDDGNCTVYAAFSVFPKRNVLGMEILEESGDHRWRVYVDAIALAVKNTLTMPEMICSHKLYMNTSWLYRDADTSRIESILGTSVTRLRFLFPLDPTKTSVEEVDRSKPVFYYLTASDDAPLVCASGNVFSVSSCCDD